MKFKRSCGILLHPTSLPNNYGIGGFGKECYEFIDFMIKSGITLWQTCPLGPTGYGDSPYQSFSTFAGNHYLIDLNTLVTEGLLDAAFLRNIPSFDETTVDYGKVIEFKMTILHKSFDKFKDLRKNDIILAKFDRFCKENSYWIDDYSLFMSIKDAFGGKSWLQWDDDIRFRTKDSLLRYQTKLSDSILFYKYLQFIFFKQWYEIKSYANNNNIQIIGDLPIYISCDSADSWINNDIFLFDENKLPRRVAGVPPDYFSTTGQLWGNPVYNWADPLVRERLFSWWEERVKVATNIADLVRLDHFRGLAKFWAVPYGSATAQNGAWYEAFGDELLSYLKSRLGTLPIIAEDLGVITQDVVSLRDKYSLPGMKILQFAFDSEESSSKSFIPHVYTHNSVVYTGTHDNNTVLGWYNDAKQHDKDYARQYLGISGDDISWGFIRGAISSVADLAIIPLQDILSLDNTARMNTPGKASGNWQWRYKATDLTDELASKLYNLIELYNRI